MNAWDICLTHDPVYGGIYRSVCNFARALEGRILSFDDGRANLSRLHDERPTVRIASRPGLWNRGCHVVTSAMRAEADARVAGADLLVVHSLFRGHAPWAARWARDHGRPYWSVAEGVLDPWALRRHSLAKQIWLARYGREFFSGATTIFATAREQQKAAPVLDVGRSVVIHWPVPLPGLDGREAARAAFRAAHGIPESGRWRVTGWPRRFRRATALSRFRIGRTSATALPRRWRMACRRSCRQGTIWRTSL